MQNRHFVRPKVAVPLALQVIDEVAVHGISCALRSERVRGQTEFQVNLKLGLTPRLPRAPVGEILIVRRDPRIAFRVVENQMNYAYLGDRLKSSAAENFPIFLADLCPG